jgi:predicted ribosome quality control (RQC) complex YloA/Tae2 family protein
MSKDMQFLRLGRHFRFKNNKIIVGRNEVENNMLLKLKDKTDYVFEVVDIPGPTTLLQGKKTQEAIEFAAKLTAKYSKAKTRKVKVQYGRKKILVTQATKKQIEKYKL